MTKPIDAMKRALEDGDLPEALGLARAALAALTQPDADLLALSGNILFKSGFKVEAAHAFARTADASPERAAFFLKLAVKLFVAEGHDEGLMLHVPRLLAVEPGDAGLAFPTAEKLFAAGRLREILPLVPHLDRSDDRQLVLLLNVYGQLGDRDAARRVLDEALKADPENAMLLVLRASEAGETCDMETQARLNPLMSDPPSHLASRIRGWQFGLWRLQWSDDEAVNAIPCLEGSRLVQYPNGFEGRPRRAVAPAGSKLRIGYLSTDFCVHATMTLLLDALRHHDAERFEIFLLCHTDPSIADKAQAAWPESLRRRIVRLHGKTDVEAADIIDGLDIDILVDLKGHTSGARLGIVNAARAPVKATYIGFPGTVSGADLDYAITDRIVTPDSSRPHFHEKLCRLPECYQANSCESRAGPPGFTRADFGLPDGAFIFAGFNAPRKIRPERLKLWAKVLRAVPGALFWGMADLPQVVENLTRAFAAEGVARERLVFSATVSYSEYLARARLSDLGLDTAPYNGHTTTSDMLWAGLPVVATVGKSFASRVSASILTAIDLPELLAENERDFVSLAVGLARDRNRLAAIRQKLEQRRFIAPLFDAERFTRHLERAYELMAERARMGLPPDHIDVPPLPPRQHPFHARQAFVEPVD